MKITKKIETPPIGLRFIFGHLASGFLVFSKGFPGVIEMGFPGVIAVVALFLGTITLQGAHLVGIATFHISKKTKLKQSTCG